MSIYSKFNSAFKACEKKLSSDNRGFTLIELMAVLVIVGVIMGAFFSGAAIYMKQKRIEDMQVRFDDIRNGLSKFVMDEPPSGDPSVPDDAVRYPCPASLTAAPGATGFGVELCPSPAAYGSLSPGDDLGGVFVAESDRGLVLIGAVPTNTLNISNDLMLDEFGNRLTYAVTLGLTGPDDDQLLRPNLDPAAVVREYKEEDPVTHAVTTKTAYTDFMIVSHGADGAGSYTSQGVPNGTACRTTTNPGDGDSVNCAWQTTYKATFRDESHNYASVFGEGAYDDMAVHSLGEDDGWWQATDGSGKDLIIKNPNANIGIGSAVPVQRLEVDGAIKIAYTSNDCNAQSAGSIRYNDGSKDVVECCNGMNWQDIAYGCADGQECNADKIGQMRFNPVTNMPEYCNGSAFVPINGADCSGRYHGEVFPQAETESVACDGGLRGQMTRTRTNEMLCVNGAIQQQSQGTWSDYDRSGCAVFPVGQTFQATCTSKAGRTQTLRAVGRGDAATALAPTGSSTWVVFDGGPYLNCFHAGTSTPPDFTGNSDCQRYAGTPGHGRYLNSCIIPP